MYKDTTLLEKSLRIAIPAIALIPNRTKRIALFEGLDFRFRYWWSKLDRHCRNIIWLQSELNHKLATTLLEDQTVRQIRFVFDETANPPEAVVDGDPTRIILYFQIHGEAYTHRLGVEAMNNDQLEKLDVARRGGNYREVLSELLNPPKRVEPWNETDIGIDDDSEEQASSEHVIPELDVYQVSMVYMMAAFETFPMFYNPRGIAYHDQHIGQVQRSLVDMKLAERYEAVNDPSNQYTKLTAFGLEVAAHYANNPTTQKA